MPIDKKGDRLDPGNYRPISLLSIISKTLEWLVRRHITAHLTNNKLLSPNQHGFVNNKSCATNLLETMDHLSFCSAAKRPVDIIFLDFAKAFDTVPHRRLLAKLEAHGICGNTLRWIDSDVRTHGSCI